MRKVFTVSASLILLIMIGGSLYKGHGHTGKGNNAQITIAEPVAAATQALPIDKSNITEEEDNNTAAPPRTSVTKGHVHSGGTSYGALTANVDEPVLQYPRPDQDRQADVATNEELVVDKAEVNELMIPELPADPILVVPPQLVVAEKKDVAPLLKHTVHFAPEIGLSANSFYNNNSSSMLRAGFYAGGIIDIGLSRHFALQPGLRYSLKGVQTGHTTTDNTMKVDARDQIDLHYLELPVDLIAKFGTRGNIRFIIGAGPYVSYLLKAQDKYTTTTTVFGNATERTTSSSSGPVASNQVTKEGQVDLSVGGTQGANTGTTTNGINSIRTLDMGVNGFIGLETPGGLYVKAGSEVGLLDIQHNANGSYSGRNYNYFISLGYLIGNRK